MRHGGLKNVERKFPNLEISEEKIKNVEEKVLILEISEEKKEIFKECQKKSKEI